MTSANIIEVVRETCIHLKLDLNQEQLQSVYFNQRGYEIVDVPEFQRDLI